MLTRQQETAKRKAREAAIVAHIRHGEQAENDAIAWVTGVKGASDPDAIEAYRAGFRAAWGQSRAAWLLHNRG